MAKNDKVVKRGVYLYLDGSEIKNDIQSVEKEMRALVSMQKKMVVGSEEYVRAGQKIRALKGIIAEHNAQLRETEQQVKKNTISFGKFVDGFNRFFGIIGAAIAALTGFTLAIRSLRDEKNKLEESQAGLQALTGLDNDSITWLTAQAKKLSTTMTKEGLRVRQSANEILDAFMLVGSAKPELLGNKEALAAVTEEAMRLQAAAKDITLNEAVDALTLSLNQYGDQADQATRYTNVLAAGSKAGSANIASQAKAIRVAGTAAASANVPIEQTVGLIETLAYKGIKDEVAGTGLKKFFLVLQTGAKDTNPAIVGLDQALESLKNKKMDAGAIKKMFGEEGYNTASVIIRNTDMVKQFTEAVTGTNIALEQSAINSNTAAAKLAQAKNELKLAGIELADRLNPAITVSTNMVTNLVKYLPGVLDWFKEWGGTMVELAAVIAAFTIAQKVQYTWMVTINAITKTATALKLAYGVAMCNLSGYTVTSYSNLKRLYLLMSGHPALLKSLRIGTYLYAATVQFLTGHWGKAATAMRSAWAIMAVNPITLLVAGLVAAAYASYKLTQRTKEYYDINKTNEAITERANKKYQEQAKVVDDLTKKVHDNSLSIGERRKAIEELKKIIPDYNAQISKEGTVIDENTEALEKYNAQLAMNIELREISDELSRRQENLAKLKKSPAFNDTSLMGSMAREDVRSKIAQEEAMIKDLNKRYEKLYQERFKAFQSPPKKNAKDANPDNDSTGGGGGTPTDKNKFASQEAEYYKKIADIKKRYLTDSKMTQEEYNREMEQAELDLLNAKLKVMGLEPEERQRINDQILSTKIQMRDKLLAEEKKTADKEKKQHEDAAKEQMRLLERQGDEELLKLTERKIKENMSEEDYSRQYKEIRLRFINEMLGITAISEDDRLALLNEKRKVELDDLAKSQEKEKELRFKQAELVLDIVDEFSNTISGMFDETTSSFKDYMKAILMLSLNTLEKIVEMTVVEVTIKSIKDGVIGLAAGAVKIAAIKAAFATVKGLVSNFYTGGYTPHGDWDQPQGIVHSDEFISNRFAVANPNLRPVFDLIDYAQRTGTVANLTGSDVAAVLSTPAPSGGTTPSGAPPSGQPIAHPDAAMIGVLQECIKVMRAVKDRFEQPIVTETYATGKRGTIEAEKLVNKMENNVSRNYLKS